MFQPKIASVLYNQRSFSNVQEIFFCDENNLERKEASRVDNDVMHWGWSVLGLIFLLCHAFYFFKNFKNMWYTLNVFEWKVRFSLLYNSCMIWLLIYFTWFSPLAQLNFNLFRSGWNRLLLDKMHFFAIVVSKLEVKLAQKSRENYFQDNFGDILRSPNCIPSMLLRSIRGWIPSEFKKCRGIGGFWTTTCIPCCPSKLQALNCCVASKKTFGLISSLIESTVALNVHIEIKSVTARVVRFSVSNIPFSVM